MLLCSLFDGGFECVVTFLFFFFKQKTAYEMRISDWSSDVCSSDLANKRAVAGALLRRITELLDLDPETLTGHTEQRLIDDLTELAAEPLLSDLGIERESVDDLVGRHPAWAGALLAYSRAYRDQAQMVTELSDRRKRDPVLADAVHQMMAHGQAVHTTSEILESADDLEPERRRRFHAILSTESARLSAEVGSAACRERGGQSV